MFIGTNFNFTMVYIRYNYVSCVRDVYIEHSVLLDDVFFIPNYLVRCFKNSECGSIFFFLYRDQAFRK